MNNPCNIEAGPSFFDGLLLLFITMMVFGIAMAVVTPPFQTPDEPAHFYRSWQIGCFETLVIQPNRDAGANLFKELHALILLGTADIPFHYDRKVSADYYRTLFRIRLETGQKKFFLFSNTAINHWYLYIPQAMAVITIRLIDAPPIFSLYFGRMLNLLSWSLCMLAAIRLYPPAKWLFLSIALMPMSLAQASSLSADALVNGTAFCFVALALRNCNTDSSVGWKESCGLIALGSLFLIGKQGYFPILAMVFLVPIRRFGSRMRYLRYCVACLAVFFFVFATRFHQLSGIRDNRKHVIPEEQLAGILANPVSYAELIARSFMYHVEEYSVSFVGNFGWLDTPLPKIMVIFYLAFILSVSLTTMKTGRFPSGKQKIVLAGIFLSNFILLMTLMYMYWTPLNNPIIFGIQGRYFIPLAPLAAVLFRNRTIGDMTRCRWFAPGFYLITWGMLSYSLVRLLERYWGDF